ncbi:cyclin-dependent kinase inhibitor 5 [Dendrobium catenatum]|uniref:Cyclin-dependent kinase inhibitor n=1 Tax=Dendrobium catenatum TaxID=906689 RepID=A0A2I0X6W6_9ASPA|nr:cyclin-dependent kinase inhibitor 5 [Dendrobium catenatum]PKU83642.1 Cyclin-dependent kinase inhibitor 3 [Dendrobium catenatum]
MGKYMRKAKLNGEVALMEVSAQSSIGVRTRARTLALQRLEKSSFSPAADNSSSSSSCYLQLRSRRLEKPAVGIKTKDSLEPKILDAAEASPEADGGLEVSFGENVLDLEARDRETTPCSLIRNSETLSTPGSTTRPTVTAVLNCRVLNTTHQNIPSTHEMEEFFAGSERLQQRTFIEKYNFDPVNDCPIPGRYEWVKLDS